jgi:hypothetical protein
MTATSSLPAHESVGRICRGWTGHRGHRRADPNTGIVNIETALQRLPANAGFAGNQTSAYWTNNGYGTAQVNLRGLGIKRTLVLLNGRRLVAGGTGANSSPIST